MKGIKVITKKPLNQKSQLILLNKIFKNFKIIYKTLDATKKESIALNI